MKLAPPTSSSSTTSSTSPPGKVRVKLGGGVAGHNGLRSADACLGTREFKRVRIGIGHPGDKERVIGHVLGDFHKAELPLGRRDAGRHRRGHSPAARRRRRQVHEQGGPGDTAGAALRRA